MFYIILLVNLVLQNVLSFSMIMKNAYLSSEQWKSINNLIKTPTLTFSMRKKINKIIYNSYQDYADNCAYKFKNIHKYSCKNIKLNELTLYSKFGLYRAIENYNGSFSFINYAEKYIMGELYRGLTDLYPLSSIPKNERRKKLNKYDKLFTKFIGCDNYWAFDKYYGSQKNEDYKDSNLDKIIYKDYINELHHFINNNLDAFSKKVFYNKYDNALKLLRNNKEIAKLMCCSEEKIRQTLLFIRSLILEYYGKI